MNKSKRFRRGRTRTKVKRTRIKVKRIYDIVNDGNKTTLLAI